jgi:hypothetical protein
MLQPNKLKVVQFERLADERYHFTVAELQNYGEDHRN